MMLIVIINESDGFVFLSLLEIINKINKRIIKLCSDVGLMLHLLVITHFGKSRL